MSQTVELHAQQVAFWNGEGGARWVEGQARIDAVLAPLADAVVAHAAARPGEVVLDVGCGCGGTTLTLAASVGATGRVTGLDVSVPMIEMARSRATGIANIDWIVADAASYAFAPATVDLLFSRFGVMFFGDPAAAFANLRRALRPTGRLAFVCWRSLQENPWWMVPLRAVTTHVPPPPRPGPEDPGPLSFADPERVTRILTQAGFAPPRLEKFDLDLRLGSTLDEAVEGALSFGPALRLLNDQPDHVRAAVVATLKEALKPHVTPAGVALGGAVWLVGATPV